MELDRRSEPYGLNESRRTNEGPLAAIILWLTRANGLHQAAMKIACFHEYSSKTVPLTFILSYLSQAEKSSSEFFGFEELLWFNYKKVANRRNQNRQYKNKRDDLSTHSSRHKDPCHQFYGHH